MTKEVLVSISGAHKMDESNDNIAIIAPGDYYFRNGKHYVIYEEMIEGANEPVKNLIKVGENTVDIVKKGNLNTHMSFEKNKKNISLYGTPLGQMTIGVNTSDVQILEEENRLAVTVNYCLDINDQTVSECCIVMDIQSKSGANFHLNS